MMASVQKKEQQTTLPPNIEDHESIIIQKNRTPEPEKPQALITSNIAPAKSNHISRSKIEREVELIKNERYLQDRMDTRMKYDAIIKSQIAGCWSNKVLKRVMTARVGRSDCRLMGIDSLWIR